MLREVINDTRRAFETLPLEATADVQLRGRIAALMAEIFAGAERRLAERLPPREANQ